MRASTLQEAAAVLAGGRRADGGAAKAFAKLIGGTSLAIASFALVCGAYGLAKASGPAQISGGMHQVGTACAYAP